jgi:hypothetical protein
MAMLWHHPRDLGHDSRSVLTDRRVSAELDERQGLRQGIIAIAAGGGAVLSGGIFLASVTHEPRPTPVECAGMFSELVRQRLECDAVDTSTAVEVGAGISAALLTAVAFVYARRAWQILR